MRCLRTLLMLSALCLMLATAAFAECIAFGPRAMKWEGSEFVFDGTVRRARGLEVALREEERRCADGCEKETKQNQAGRTTLHETLL